MSLLDSIVQAISFFFSRLFLFRDILHGFSNILFGRLKPSLLPRLSKKDLTGKVALITGGNSGIGYSIAKQLALRGCTVYLACRNLNKARIAAEEIEGLILQSYISKQLSEEEKQTEIDKKIHILELDTSSFASVRHFVEALSRYQKNKTHKIDILYHNAGVSGASYGSLSEDEIDLTHQTNFLSSFLLTYLLLEQNSLSPNARIIFTTSTGQYGGKLSPDFASEGTKGRVENGYHYPPTSGIKPPAPSELYVNTKLMQVALAKLLQRKFGAADSKMSSHSFTPAYCLTPIFEKADPPSLTSDPMYYILILATVIAVPVDEGAATGVWLADAEVRENELGGYWDRCEKRVSNADIMSEAMLKKLWERWCIDAGVEWAMS